MDFAKIDTVLAFLGFRVFPSARFYKYMNFVLRIVGLLIYLSTTAAYLTSNKQHDDIILSSWFVLKYCALIVSHNLFWWKTGAFKEILDDCKELGQRLKLSGTGEKVSKNLAIIWFGGTILAIVFALLKSHTWVLNVENSIHFTMDATVQVIAMVVFEIVLMLFTYGWLFATCIFYFYFYFKIQTFNGQLAINYIKRLHDDEEMDKINLMNELKWVRQDIQAIENKVNVHLGWLPLIWLFIAALEISWLIITTDKFVLTYFQSNFYLLCAHDALYLAFAFGSIAFAIFVYREEVRATWTLSSFLKTVGGDTRELVAEKTRLTAQITLRPVVMPKMLNFVPLNAYVSLLYIVLVVAGSFFLRVIDDKSNRL